MTTVNPMKLPTAAKLVIHAYCAALVSALLLIACACSSSSTPSSQMASSPAPQTAAQASGFDYYLLALSWAPQFCATSNRMESSECDPARRYGLVVHGLWPQNDNGSYPENCAPERPVAEATVRQLLPIMPSRGLVQHEWKEHGNCTGLDAQSYFGGLQQAFARLQVPQKYRGPEQSLRVNPADMARDFADANHAVIDAFRVACSGGEFSGIDVCLTKDLKYRSCGSGVRECRARSVTIRPIM